MKDQSPRRWSWRSRVGLRLAVGYVVLALVAGGALTLAPAPGGAHIVPEEPWHPVAGAYLRALFYLNLRPVDWDLVAAEYEGVREVGYGVTNAVYEGLGPAQAVAGIDHAAAVRDAIQQRDAAALYSASTRAVAQLTRHHLAETARQLNNAGAAQDQMLRAQALYRALAEDWLEQFDPEAFARLGRSWLELASSIGTAGISGTASVAAARTRFDQARAEIDTYLAENYEPAAPTALGWYAPTPATALSRLGSDYLPTPALPPGSNLNDQVPLPRLVLNFEERGIDEADLFLVAYGDMLFDSPEIFGSPARDIGLACATCHNRSDINQALFIPGVSARLGGADVDGHFFNPRFNDRRNDHLDTPSLRGIRFTGPYGRDGRIASLRDFTRNVIVNEFAGAEPTPLMLDALVVYMFEFDWLPNPLLRQDGQLVRSAPPAARRGEQLFNRRYESMGNLSCATCHDPRSNFVDHRRHDIGSGNPASPGALDSAFDTPTLLNIQFTAPYFHDGSLATLPAVVAWKDSRYGLALSTRQQRDLVAYLEAVGGGVDPHEIFDDENTEFRLFWEELSTFASTLSTLIPARDAFHADLMVATVAPDLRADASALRDTRQAPMVFELADLLLEIQSAWQADDWARAADLWAQWQQLADDYGPQLR